MQTDWALCPTCGAPLDYYRPPRATFGSGPNSGRRRRRGHDWIWWAVVPAVIIVVIVVAALLLLTYLPREPKTQTLVTPGTLLPVAGDSAVWVSFELSESSRVNGGFVSTAPVWTYILNQSEFKNLSSSSSGTPANSTWTAGEVSNLTFSVELTGSSGGTSWYLTFVNLGLDQAVVNVTAGVTATS